MGTLTDDAKMDLVNRTIHRLDEERRKELAKRVLLILYRRGQATLAHLRAAGVRDLD